MRLLLKIYGINKRYLSQKIEKLETLFIYRYHLQMSRAISIFDMRLRWL